MESTNSTTLLFGCLISSPEAEPRMTRSRFPSHGAGGGLASSPAATPTTDFDFATSSPVGVPFCPTHEDDDEEEEEEAALVGMASRSGGFFRIGGGKEADRPHQAAVLDLLSAALRKSFVTCSVEVETDEEDDVAGVLDISWPTDVTHLSHVTFDRFDGFLGLPSEFQPELPHRVPSASVSAFGVSSKSMQCTYDNRGNSVPTILLMMQKRLYNGGGLKAEGIFRINAENSQEIYVREQINKGVVPHGIDVHCLAGLIKAWFRELPRGVLDSLAPEKVMLCTTEEEYMELVKLVPPTEAALLDWAIDLMADVAREEAHNKMNARNIAMVFAPNMTQMDDPLTALIHAVQVMNFLKVLIVNRLRERGEAPASLRSTCSEFQVEKDEPEKKATVERDHTCLVTVSEEGCSEYEEDETVGVEEEEEEVNSSSSSSSIGSTNDHVTPNRPERWRRGSGRNEIQRYVAGGIGDRKGGREWLRRRVWKLCRQPVFHLSRASRRSAALRIVGSGR